MSVITNDFTHAGYKLMAVVYLFVMIWTTFVKSLKPDIRRLDRSFHSRRRWASSMISISLGPKQQSFELQSTPSGDIVNENPPRRRIITSDSKYKRLEFARSSDDTVSTTAKAFGFGRSKSMLSGGSGPKKIMSQGQPRVNQIINPNRLKIIAGSAKGKKLESPNVYLRPMMAKVREALFSTLEHIGVFENADVRILDTFSGSGSVGLEALSRGASHTTFVDLSPDCIETAQRNALTCGFDGRTSAVCAKAEDVLMDPKKYGLSQPYNVISITPPYEEVIYTALIDAICESPLVVEDTLVIIEYPVEMGTLPYILGNDKLFGVRNRKYGRTVIALYVYRPNKKYDMRCEEFQKP